MFAVAHARRCASNSVLRTALTRSTRCTAVRPFMSRIRQRLSSRTAKMVLLGFGAANVGAFSYLAYLHSKLQGAASVVVDDSPPIENTTIPSRDEQLEALQSGQEFDILVIGGGATGAGIALDAITRGLSVALVERDDFSAGTSGRSTKLIHGGVRYLEAAFRQLDRDQLKLVKEALVERRHLISISPHLSRPIPIIVPLYIPFPQILFFGPYYWVGMKLYDIMAGAEGLLEPSFWISRREALEKFPMLKKRGLKGGVVYYDGQHNDSRMNVALALTAAAKGAVVVNHVEVKDLLWRDARPDEVQHTVVKDRVVYGIVCRDLITGRQWRVKAKAVVNATGPFSDAVRKMSTGRPITDLILPSSGVHVVLPDRFSPEGMGLIVPETADGRVLFLLPWEGSTIAGTTDSSAVVTSLPRPHQQEIKFIMDEVSNFLSDPVTQSDIDAAWSGIRPLARVASAGDGSTSSVSRDHVIEFTAPGLTTIAGGKWTTYRLMAEHLVDALLPSLNKPAGPCITKNLKLVGAHGWSLGLTTRVQRLGFSYDIARHLDHNYGDKAVEVARIAKTENLEGRLAGGYPIIEAEIVYAMRHEYAMNAMDVISRRTRLAVLNADAAYNALDRVIAVMAKEAGWSPLRRLQEFMNTHEYLGTMQRRGRRKQVMNESDKTELARAGERVRTVFGYASLSAAEIARLKKSFDVQAKSRVVDKEETEDWKHAHKSLKLHIKKQQAVAIMLEHAELLGFDAAKVKTWRDLPKGLLRALKCARAAALSEATAKNQPFLVREDLKQFDAESLISWDEFVVAISAAVAESGRRR